MPGWARRGYQYPPGTGPLVLGCPRDAVRPWVRPWFDLYAHYRNKILLRAGGWGSQPMDYAQAMTIIDAEVNRIEAQRNAELERRVAQDRAAAEARARRGR